MTSNIAPNDKIIGGVEYILSDIRNWPNCFLQILPNPDFFDNWEILDDVDDNLTALPTVIR